MYTLSGRRHERGKKSIFYYNWWDFLLLLHMYRVDFAKCSAGNSVSFFINRRECFVLSQWLLHVDSPNFTG